ncbi:MAG: hypothetical protein KDJ65_25735 [Anaerolineae bacterium]|nr:hypothetical protein [Anaerolineae bacterium]
MTGAMAVRVLPVPWSSPAAPAVCRLQRLRPPGAPPAAGTAGQQWPD